MTVSNSAWNTYQIAVSIPDALAILANAPGEARLVAGGTDLLLDLQQGRHAPVNTLVDVTRIAELRQIEIRHGKLFIGAAAPLNTIVASPLVKQHAQALQEAAGLIGGPQVRNTATLGGNVAHALPAGDGAMALLALDAQAEIATSQARRFEPMEKLYLGPGRSALEARRELLVGFHISLHNAGEGSAFQRVMRPQGVAIAILNMGIWVQRTGNLMNDVRISLGPAGPVPLRARHSENILRGNELSDHLLKDAYSALLAEARFRTSPHRATAEYRRQIAGVLLRQTLHTAWDRATQVSLTGRTREARTDNAN
jgi:carbon-monoxide dehydrogenase medium subunit